MDQYELAQALQRLDELLSSPLELVLVGGAAMILHFGANGCGKNGDKRPSRRRSQQMPL